MSGIGMLMTMDGKTFSHVDGHLLDAGYRVFGYDLINKKKTSRTYFNMTQKEAEQAAEKEGLENITSKSLSEFNLFKDLELKQKFTELKLNQKFGLN